VDKLLEIPGMSEPSFRQELYQLLPSPIQVQLPRHATARAELIGVVSTLAEYRHLDSWNALVRAVTALVPDDPVVADLAAIVAELDT
jgi:Effector-associated domain 2